jgi:hypothetical protein
MRSRLASVWWLHPAFIFAAAGVVIGFAAYATPESSYRQLWRTPKFFDVNGLLVTLACVAVFVFGAVVSAKLVGRVVPLSSDDLRASFPVETLSRLFNLSFYLCVFGYLLWIGLAMQRGMSLSDVLGVIGGEKGAMYDARFTYLPTVGGVTTLTQFGTAVAILGALMAFCYGWRTVRFKLMILMALAGLRALVNSERFALIELFVPFTVTALALGYMGSKTISPAVRRLVNVAPLIGVTALFLLFTGFEYFRSWTNYYAGRDMSLLQFGAMRLLGYYVTSFNNGAYFLHRLDPLNAPYFTLHFLWGFPLTGTAIKRLFPNPLLDSSDKWFYFPFLESDANLEFNNADGVLFPLMDYGLAGGLIYWLLIGMLCGFLYQMYKRHKPIGLLMYPVTFLGLMELPLALYWGEGRAFPSLCLLALAPLFLRMSRRQKVFGPASYRPLVSPGLS